MKHNVTSLRVILTAFVISSLCCFGYAGPLPADTIRQAQDTLGTDHLKEDTLKEVSVAATRFLFITRNDTTIYDLDALNLKGGDLLKDAFEKLPGMSFRDGKLYHNGREVKRVLINGMDFSSKDPLLALQALPSYIMKHVKVYERKSDFAMRYDVDDGKEELVADVSMRRKYMGTWTGEAVAGGGTDKRFRVRGFGNTFTDQYRVSLFGNANNINEQMWYNGDGKEHAEQQQAGDNSFYTPGGTFFWKNKKTTKERGYFRMEGGADYNKELYDKEERQSSELYLSDGSMFSASDTRRKTDTDRMSGHLKADWNITDALSASYVGTFNVRRSKNNGSTLKANWNENPIPDGGSIADTLKYLTDADSRQPKATDLQHNRTDEESDQAAHNHTLRFDYKAKAKTYLALTYNLSFNNSRSEEENYTNYKYFNDEAARSTRIDRFLDKNSNRMNQGVMARVMKYFDVKGFSRFCIFAEYNYKRNESTDDEKGYLLGTDATSQQRVIDDETTRKRESWTNHHSVEGSLSVRKGLFYFEVKPTFNYRTDELSYAKRGLPALNPRRNYSYISGRAAFRIRWPNVRGLFVQYYITPHIPDISYFVTYPDKADPQYIILGNENLRKGSKQELLSWYERNFTKETEKGKITRTLYANLLFSHSDNDVTLGSTYNRETGGITVRPVNVSGNRVGNVSIGFNTPLDMAQHFWLETSARASVQHTQTYSEVATADNTEQQFNDNRLYTYAATVKPRLKLAPVDLSVTYRLALEDNHGSYASANNKAQWHHLVTGNLNGQLPLRLNLNATVSYHNYTGYLSGRRENWVMLDFGIERAFLRSENLLVNVSVHDLLNQNNGFLSQYSATALTHTYRKTLGRYGMLTLKYRFSSKKK